MSWAGKLEALIEKAVEQPPLGTVTRAGTLISPDADWTVPEVVVDTNSPELVPEKLHVIVEFAVLAPETGP